jgi:hypothetical protein
MELVTQKKKNLNHDLHVDMKNFMILKIVVVYYYVMVRL